MTDADLKQWRMMRLAIMSNDELAHWLVNSFSPERYRDSGDVVQFGCRLLYDRSKTGLASEFINKLWGMFGLPPDEVIRNNVIEFRRKAG